MQNKVCMQGVFDKLWEIKPQVKQLYNEITECIKYWENNCAANGWDWEKDKEELENQKNVIDGVQQLLKEAYNLILDGVGQKGE